MSYLVKVNKTDLEVKVFKGQRVVTFKDIDSVHQRPCGTASRNFKTNRKHFIEDEDYFVVKPNDFQKDEIRLSGINNRGTTFVTETGYLMLVKSFTDDLAWQVQRELVKNYFRAKEQPQENQSCTPTQKLYKGQPVAIIQDISRITGFSKGAIRHVINKNCSVFDYKVLKGTELLHFKSENHLQKRLHSLIIIFESGVKKLAKIYEFKPDMLFTASNYKIIPKTFEGEPVLFYEDIMALTGLSCRQIDEYVLTEARKAPLDGICMLTVYGLPKFKQENPHLKKYLEKEKLVPFIKKKGAINLLKGCGCSKRDVKKVMDYYNQNVSIETNTIYNLDYQKLFVQLDTSNRNKVLNTMIQLYDEQMENENKVKSFSKKQNKNMLLSTQ